MGEPVDLKKIKEIKEYVDRLIKSRKVIRQKKVEDKKLKEGFIEDVVAPLTKPIIEKLEPTSTELVAVPERQQSEIPSIEAPQHPIVHVDFDKDLNYNLLESGVKLLGEQDSKGRPIAGPINQLNLIGDDIPLLDSDINRATKIMNKALKEKNKKRTVEKEFFGKIHQEFKNYLVRARDLKKSLKYVQKKGGGILSNCDDVITRLNLLVSSLTAGNTSKKITNEVIDLLNFLLVNSVITKEEYKSLYDHLIKK